MRKLLNDLGNKKSYLKAIKDNKSNPVDDRLKASKELNKTSESITNAYAPKPKEL